MNFLKNLLSKDEKIHNYKDFWNWFLKHERKFWKVVQAEKNIETDFLNKIDPKLKELRDGYFYLTGMYKDNTVELVITADGNIINIPFVEELIKAAPQIDGWKFTALKPALVIDNVAIHMDDYIFSSENMFFYSTAKADYPDEISITVVH